MTSPKHPAHEVDQTALARPAREASISPIPEERRILAMAGQARRVGKWLVPRVLRVRAFLGEVGSAYLGEVRVLVREP
jgi:hypothetical protein